MTFDESKHNRERDGKFASKPHAEAEGVSLEPQQRVSDEQVRDTANQFRKAISVPTLMSLGASDFCATKGKHGLGGLQFTARILPFKKDGTRSWKARNMRVIMSHTPSDLIDVDVVHATTGKKHYSTEGIYVEDLNRALFALDYDGKEATNPRLWRD